MLVKPLSSEEVAHKDVIRVPNDVSRRAQPAIHNNRASHWAALCARQERTFYFFTVERASPEKRRQATPPSTHDAVNPSRIQAASGSVRAVDTAPPLSIKIVVVTKDASHGKI